MPRHFSCARPVGSRSPSRPKFRPRHARHFAATLAGEDQQADDRAVGRRGLGGGVPNLCDFSVAQHALALGNALPNRQGRKRIGVHGAARRPTRTPRAHKAAVRPIVAAPRGPTPPSLKRSMKTNCPFSSGGPGRLELATFGLGKSDRAITEPTRVAFSPKQAFQSDWIFTFR